MWALGSTPVSCTMGTGSISRGVKQPGRGVDHPAPSNTEVKERVSYNSTSLHGPSWPVPGRTLTFTVEVSTELTT
jgi:hypothetical protein